MSAIQVYKIVRMAVPMTDAELAELGIDATSAAGIEAGFMRIADAASAAGVTNQYVGGRLDSFTVDTYQFSPVIGEARRVWRGDVNGKLGAKARARSTGGGKSRAKRK